MESPEIILNLWYVYDNLGMIYSLLARCYVGTGTDEEKLASLHRFAHTDYLIAQHFPLPPRLHTTLVSDGAQKTLPMVSRRAVDELGGTHLLFEEVFAEMEKQLPARTRLSIGRNRLVCITPLPADEEGRIRPEYSRRERMAP
jgi:hypothetical protein